MRRRGAQEITSKSSTARSVRFDFLRLRQDFFAGNLVHIPLVAAVAAVLPGAIGGKPAFNI
jgi:hypothetical protein